MFTNDTFQGREHAKFVPLSDQWGSSPTFPLEAQRARHQDFGYTPPETKEVHVKKNHRPENYHRKNVLNDSNGRAVTTEVIEDIFHAWESWGNHPNPHNSRTCLGKYYFDFPTSWRNSNTVARAIALRSIMMHPEALFFPMELLFDAGEQPPQPALHVTIFISIPSKYSIDQALSAICKTVNKVLPSHFPSKLDYSWEATSLTASLFLRDNDGSEPTGFLQIESVGDGFKFLFNIPDADLPEHLQQTQRWTFRNVWDRKNIFFHASFVSNSSFHYLGTNGEFYTSPSKIYYQNFTGNDFEVYLTVDGVNPLVLYYQDFSIELSFIIDRNHYQE
jgi:hypothetical protein